MQIVEGQYNFSNLNLGNSVGIVSIEKPANVSDLYPGPDILINNAKSLCEKVIVYFISTKIHGLPCFSWNKGWTREQGPFDKDGSIAWAESKGADVVIIQEPNQYELLLANLDLESEIVWARDLYESEKYPFNKGSERESNFLQMYHQWFIVLKNFDRGWTHFYTWKEGYGKFSQKEFHKKYTNSPVMLLDPIYTPEGLFYSSVYNTLSVDEKNVLIQIPAIMQNNYSSSELLLSSLNAISGSIGITFDQAVITIGNSEFGWVVGEKNDLIQVFYSLTGNRSDFFTVYKKDVR